MASEQVLLQMVFLIPILTMLVSSFVKNDNFRDFSILALSITLFIVVFCIYLDFSNGKDFYIVFSKFGHGSPGLEISFKLEPLGMLFALLLTFLWPVTALYSVGYMRGNKESNQGSFSFFFALSILAALGVAFSANLITLFIFYEILTISTFPLVAHKKDEKARIGSKTYIKILMGASILFFLPAIIITWVTTSTLDFTLGGIFSKEVSKGLISVLFLLYILGIAKAALMPLHKWLPAAMVAPTPVSALLHAVAVVKTGVFCIIKIVIYIFGVQNLRNLVEQSFFFGGWLTYVAGATIIIASLIALRQDNLKKILAYSTISQLSYIIMALSIFNEKAIWSAVFHMIAHAFGKITLFFAAGAIYTVTKKTNVSQLDGIGKVMPITMIAFAVGTLSMIGIPPAAGFISKWYMIDSAAQQEYYFVFIIMTLSTLLNTGYFFPIIYRSFFVKAKNNSESVNVYSKTPVPILISFTITSSVSIILFFFPNFVLDLIKTIH